MAMTAHALWKQITAKCLAPSSIRSSHTWLLMLPADCSVQYTNLLIGSSVPAYLFTIKWVALMKQRLTGET